GELFDGGFGQRRLRLDDGHVRLAGVRIGLVALGSGFVHAVTIWVSVWFCPAKGRKGVEQGSGRPGFAFRTVHGATLRGRSSSESQVLTPTPGKVEGEITRPPPPLHQ